MPQNSVKNILSLRNCLILHSLNFDALITEKITRIFQPVYIWSPRSQNLQQKNKVAVWNDNLVIARTINDKNRFVNSFFAKVINKFFFHLSAEILI